MAKSIVLKVINTSAFKRVSVVVVILLFIIQGISYVDTGGNVCGRLLNGGTLVDIDVWHPTGCMIHNYKPNDGSSCLKKQKVAFVGDEHMRNVYQSFMKKFFENSNIKKTETELKFQESNLAVDFFERPYLDSSINSLYESWLETEDEAPNIIIQSAATPSSVNADNFDEDVEQFRANLSKLTPLMNSLVANNSKLYWMLQAPEAEVLSSDHTTEDNVVVNKNLLLLKYNEAIEVILGSASNSGIHTNISIVNSPAEVASQTLKQSKNGFSHPGSIAELTTQILMNLFCNDVQRPIDGSCCQRPPPVTFLQTGAFIVGIVCVSLSVLISCVRLCTRTNSDFVTAETSNGGGCELSDVEKDAHMRSYSYNENTTCNSKHNKKESRGKQLCGLITALGRLSMILLYFYICDRSDVFMKANKHFTTIRFCVPLIYLILIGIFGINRSKQSGFFNQDQSDEWKGWMILFILVYHMTGAYEKTWITMHYQLFISMYLFIIGYTNFNHYWNTGDFGIRRMFSIVMRTNLLAVLLCVVMNRTYQFYFFVPLSTFWFFLLYLFMAIPPRAYLSPKSQQEHDQRLPSSKLRWICSPFTIATFKFVVMIFSICVVSRFENEFSNLFTWWPIVRLFEQTRGSVQEWWQIVQLDRFSMVFGAITAFGYQLLKRFSVVDDLKQGCLFSTKASLLSFITSFFCFLGFSYWSSQCNDEENCKPTYTYICLMPMTSYLLLRNIPGYVRSGFSSFFAWFGKIYLELFIAQYHIWSAADGKGVLVVLASNWPMLNLIITTLVFVCVAHEVNRLTSIFTNWFVGSSQDSVRRLFVRIFILLAGILLFVIVNDVTNSRSES